MNLFNHLESTLAGLYKDAPHLPAKGRRWLTSNSWRIDILGAVLSVFSVFVIIPVLFTVVALTPDVNSLIMPYVPYDQTSLGLAWVALLMTAVVFFVTAIMLSCSVNLVKEQRREGWSLMYKAYLLNVLLGVVTVVMVPSVVELATVILITLIAGYFLFEVRDSFKHSPRSIGKK